MANKRFDSLANYGCCVCRVVHHAYSPACIHHLTGIKYRATGKKANDEHSIPLCHRHHQGEDGIHTLGMRVWEERFGKQEVYLEMVNEYLDELGINAEVTGRASAACEGPR